ncbi:MAG: hypothetical protein QHH26_06765 [Armatimonadota bacterium]|nr:hypothetical protein [Armatimonadota bacterium]
MSIFEMIMLLCFGASWPFSLYKTIKTKNVGGKSAIFLTLITIGYLSGIAHKIIYNPDPVIALYALNAIMVGADLALWMRYRNQT